MTSPLIGAKVTPALTDFTNAALKPTKVEDAARQFESLMIAEMLRPSRESGSAGLGGGGLEGDDTSGEPDSESSTMLDLADQQFAQLLAKNGGIGLTQLVISGLKRADPVAN